MTELYGFAGKILRVDLTNGKISIEDTTKYAPRFMGLGIGLKVMWDEVPPETDPFDPENRLILCCGPLVGTKAPSSGRTEVVSKSPHTWPKALTTRSGFGGYWGAELKSAGYDAIIAQGKAEDPVYLWIKDENVEVRDAKKLWGLDTYATQDEIRRELGDPDVQIATIGPAGENLSRVASIIHDTGHGAGQGGFGGVMGSKNLKAVAVRGTGSVKMARPKELAECVKKTRPLLTMDGRSKLSPFWIPGVDEHDVKDEGCLGRYNRAKDQPIEPYVKEQVGCSECPICCFVYYEVPDLRPARMTCVQFGLGMETKDPRVQAYAHQLSDGYGINGFEMSIIRNLCNYLLEKGYMTEEEMGIPWSEAGTWECVDALYKSIAFRRGFGDLLAEGAFRTAEKLGVLDEILKGAGKGCGFGCHGLSVHYEPRDWVALGLQWCMDARMNVSLHHDTTHVVYWSAVPWENQKEIARFYYGSDKVFGEGPNMPLYCKEEAYHAHIVKIEGFAMGSLTLCDWAYPNIVSPYEESLDGRPPFAGDPSIPAKLLSHVMGIETTLEDVRTIGERCWNLQRALIVREWGTRDIRGEHDTLPGYFFAIPPSEEPPRFPRKEPKPLDKEGFERLKDYYYEISGWDVKTGLPTRKKLEELDLKEVADELEGLGLLGC
ncbi:MAG: aldehyde ferredoxin oxidoreductase N-terminal domain-containing protein [Candidatus Bathyarchaeia archaeon]